MSSFRSWLPIARLTMRRCSSSGTVSSAATSTASVQIMICWRPDMRWM
jgi:hypothetical protein